MSARIGAIVMAALLVLYLVFVGQYALVLIGIDEPVAKAMGVALAVLPLIGAWALIAEFVFLARGQKLLRRLEDEGGAPEEELPRLPSGRIDAAVAREHFPKYQQAVEAEPGSWQAWARLSLSYDASGDRGRARWAMREAIRLQRTAS